MNPQNAQQFRELIWDIKITVKIQLPDTKAPSLYLQIYRQHYLLFYYQQIYDHFNHYQPIQYRPTQMSLNFKNKTLPYQVPFGVLVDCMQLEETYTPLTITIIFQQADQFDDLEKEMKNQLKFNLKWSSLGRYNHPGYGVPLKLLQQYTKASEEEQIFKKIFFHFEQKESIFQYYQKIFEDSDKQIQIPVRIYFVEGGHLQTLLEIQDPTTTIGNALSTICKDGQFIFYGVPLDLNIPAMYFYAYLYYIDGFCYFACK